VRRIYFRTARPGKKYFTQYAKIDDPGMLEGSLKYAQDFTEKIPLVKREGVQVVLDQETAKKRAAERVYARTLL
jgi:hypothetical protein